MNNLPNLTLLTLALFAAAAAKTDGALAHDGPHDAPGDVQAPKGGLIRTTEDGHFELLRKRDPQSKLEQLTLYFYDVGDLSKPRPVEGVQIEAKLILPGADRKKAPSVAFMPQGDHWTATLDAKKAHRYTLDFAVVVGKTSHKLKYTLEPKR